MVKPALGALYVIATPIGNLDDISSRALRTLTECDLILVEDTRRTGILLQRYGIDTPMQVFHEHTECRDADHIADRIAAGQEIALVSDAGMPLISDPGFVLVRALRQRGLEIRTIPGPSAVLAALSISGLATDRFCFEGFLPASETARRHRLQALATETRTIVFFEAPHRLLESLQSMTVSFGAGRPAFIGRELTKKFETGLFATLAKLHDRIQLDPNQSKGECVIVVSGAELIPNDTDDNLDKWLLALLHSLPLKQAVMIAARACDHNRNHIYRRALELQNRR